ncbi:MAG: hypothetical protein R3F59_32465 [Myxococcota bacterium]
MTATQAGFVGVLLAVGAMRLVELAVSVRRMRARPDAVVAEPALFPMMAALHAGLVALPIAEVFWLHRPFVPAVAAAAAAVLLPRTILRVWTLRTLGRVWNVRVVRPPTAWSRPGRTASCGTRTTCARDPRDRGAADAAHGVAVGAGADGVERSVLAVRIPTEEAELSRLERWREAFADTPRLFPRLIPRRAPSAPQ